MRRMIVTLSALGLSATAFGQERAPQRGASRPGAAAAAEQQSSAPPYATAPANNNNADHVGATMRQRGGSLLKASLAAQNDPAQATLEQVSFTAVPVPEPKVIRKHDLLTIIVREQSEFSSEGSTEFTKEAELQALLDEFIKLDLANWEIEGGGIGEVAPSIRMSGSRDMSGEGTVERSDDLTARITAEVLDVKPNGTLVLQARKRIKTDEEEQIFTLSGTCRAEDINADNTILSTALHDQELVKTHRGTVRNATRKGWGGKLLDAISPF